jgi:hypothetical protein
MATTPPRRGPGGKGYTPPSEELPGFPNAKQVRPKTRRSGAGFRKRWKDPDDGTIYEWDSQHGTVEKYDGNGHHLGEFDPDTGEQIKPKVSGRRVEP